MDYAKPAITISDQIRLLKERGLEIKDDLLATKYFEQISYYRLAGYWWPMYADKEKHIFKSGSNFDDVIALYSFDQELRLLLIEALEKIEISLRTKLIYHLSHEFDPWWFQNIDLFIDSTALIETLGTILEEVSRSKDTFIKQHRIKYKDDKRFPPAWKTLELTSFGNLSKLYGNLKPKVASKDKIACEYGVVNHTYLPSWLQSMTQIRNYCAHHSRLWNRNLPGSPKLLASPPNPWLIDVPKQHEFQKIYIHICLIKYLLDTIHPQNSFALKFSELIEKYKKNIDPVALGLKKDWQHEPLWKN